MEKSDESCVIYHQEYASVRSNAALAASLVEALSLDDQFVALQQPRVVVE
jgi:hypothetical protein